MPTTQTNIVTGGANAEVTPAEARAIVKEAYIWSYPLVDDYRIFYAYFLDQSNPEFKADTNHWAHNRRLYTPDDKAIQSINADTLYSFIGMDLRAEPILITVPQVQKGRYYGISLFDLWGFCHMIGTRTTGNEAGIFMIAGPGWKGDTPPGVKKVFHMETSLGAPALRIQLFDPEDIDNVKKVQDGFKVQTLSAFLGRPAMNAPPVHFVAPLTVAEEKSSLEFFGLVNFLLQFAPTDPSEVELKARVARVGIGAHEAFDSSKLTPEMKTAFEQGIADAWVDIDGQFKKLDSGQLTLGDFYGTRAYLKNNYLNRMTGIVFGGNAQPKEEVIYPVLSVDADGKLLDGANKYTVHFAADNMPPCGAFWSITMYDLPGRHLVANPLNRYLLNTPMQPKWVRDADGGYTFYIQNQSPGSEKEPNWLPAPKGPFYMIMRVYLPSKAAQDGVWKAPKPTKVQS